VLVLMHAHDSAHEDPRFLAFARRLSGMLAVAIETRQLIAAQKALLESLIRLMADAIDAKSPYTGGHCERVPHWPSCWWKAWRRSARGPMRTSP
jgi:HD-GYP domain-containing protein (c-di-GMP phosphodiesterase class II)